MTEAVKRRKNNGSVSAYERNTFDDRENRGEETGKKIYDINTFLGASSG